MSVRRSHDECAAGEVEQYAVRFDTVRVYPVHVAIRDAGVVETHIGVQAGEPVKPLRRAGAHVLDFAHRGEARLHDHAHQCRQRHGFGARHTAAACVPRGKRTVE